MGATSSKVSEDSIIQRHNNIRRSSASRKSTQSKTDQIESTSTIVEHLKNEIDIFAGNRTSSRYKEFQKILTKLASDLQKIKNKSKKQQFRDRCDEVQGQIQNCLQRLETKVNFNEQCENSLDLATIESHSFINHNFNQRPPPAAVINQKWVEAAPPPSKQRAQKNDSIKTLEHIQQEALNLEKDISASIELEDTKQFVIYEGKIKILYTDLEMIRVDDNTPLSDKKAAIGKKLIKSNNQIKRFKKKINTTPVQTSTQDGGAFSKPSKSVSDQNDQFDELNKIEQLLEDLEIQALTFEGFKSDKKYKELEQVLESHWTKVYALDAFGDVERRRKSLTIERTKNILQELRKRAEENEKQTKAIRNIHRIELQVQGLKKEAEKFQGTTKDPFYINLDQQLRTLWANLNEVEEPNEHVRRSKVRVINDIQYVLKNFCQDSQTRESKIYENNDVLKTAEVAKSTENSIDEEILQKQLLKQVEEFQNHWNQLNYNLDVQKISKSEISKNIIEIFEKILEGVHKKSNALSIIEKRKSNSSLVIAKVIDNTDMSTKFQPVYTQKPPPEVAPPPPPTATKTFKLPINTTYQNQYQPPDLLQQQVINPPFSKPIETEIKVQPTVKVIGEMQRVGTEAKVLLQQIRQSTCTKHDDEYNIFQVKLQECKSVLSSIEYNKRSDTIESNRRRANKTINEALRVLEEKSSLKPYEEAAIRSSKAQEVMDIDAEIQYFRQQIKNFTSVTKDKQYEKIKQGLSESLGKLQVIDDMHISKQESIRQIQQYHQELETKLAENQAKVKISEQQAEIRRQTSQDIKGVIEQVQKLRSQVERFSGVYEGLLYKQIEGNFRKCSEKLEVIDSKGDDRFQNAKMQTKQKIQKYLMILQDKSMKTSTPEETQTPLQEEQKPYHEHVVKESVQPQRVYSASLDEQQNFVTSTKGEQPQVDNATPAQQVMYRQKALRHSQIVDPDSPHHKINSLRDKLMGIKNQTETFTGNFKDQHYSDIEKQLLNCTKELRMIDDRGHKSVIISKEQYADYIEKLLEYFEEKAKTSEFEHQKEKTGVKVQKVSETNEVLTLSNNVQVKQSVQKFKIVDPTEELAVIEEKVVDLKEQVNNFKGTAKDELYVNLEQVLTGHIVKLENIQVGNVAHVRERKRKLAQELHNCTKMLEEKAKNGQEILDWPKNQEQMKKIDEILKELEEIAPEINAFSGVKNDRNYCYLDEVLIKLTIKLDNTETYGNSELRSIRKKAIQEIQRNMRILAERAAPKDTGIDFTASQV